MLKNFFKWRQGNGISKGGKATQTPLANDPPPSDDVGAPESVGADSCSHEDLVNHYRTFSDEQLKRTVAEYAANAIVNMVLAKTADEVLAAKADLVECLVSLSRRV